MTSEERAHELGLLRNGDELLTQRERFLLDCIDAAHADALRAAADYLQKQANIYGDKSIAAASSNSAETCSAIEQALLDIQGGIEALIPERARLERDEKTLMRRMRTATKLNEESDEKVRG